MHCEERAEVIKERVGNTAAKEKSGTADAAQRLEEVKRREEGSTQGRKRSVGRNKPKLGKLKGPVPKPTSNGDNIWRWWERRWGCGDSENQRFYQSTY